MKPKSNPFLHTSRPAFVAISVGLAVSAFSTHFSLADTIRDGSDSQNWLTAGNTRYEIDLVACTLNSRLYARMSVSESLFADCMESPKIDYVPLASADLAGLVGLDAQSMVIRLENLSMNQDCIVTVRGQAKWHDRVIHPYIQ